MKRLLFHIALFTLLVGSTAPLSALPMAKAPESSRFGQAELSVYPNPAMEHFTVEFRAQTRFEVVITNILGTELYRSRAYSPFESRVRFNLSNLHLNPGIYIVKVYENKHVSAAKKLIVKAH